MMCRFSTTTRFLIHGLLMLYLPGSPSALLWPVEWGLVGAWFALGWVFYRIYR